MKPMTEVWVRRLWPAIASLILLGVLTFVHQFWFQPTAKRYSRILKEATAVGMPLDVNDLPRIMPPRLFARIADNSIPAARAQEIANSGQLTAEFLGELSGKLSHRGLVVTSTDPAATSNNELTIVLRAHLRARGRYSDFVLLLDDLSLDTRLYAIDRFTVVPDAGGAVNIELWASRLILKSQGRS